MTPTVSRAARAAALIAGCAAARAGDAVRIVESPPAADAAVVPWADGSFPAVDGPPTFALEEKDVPIAARGWVALDGDALLLRVEVRDDLHVNRQSGGSIWNGDFLRVGVDAWGDGAAGRSADAEGAMGPDDISIGFALSSEAGAVGWVYTSLDPSRLGAWPADRLRFARDEAAKTTRYDIRIPWADLSAAAGLTPAFGLAVQIRNVAAEGDEPHHLRWGGDERRFLPGRFVRLQAAPPPRDVAAVVPRCRALWVAGQPLLAVAAVASAAPRRLAAEAAGGTAAAEIPGDAARAFRRYVVEYLPPRGREEEPLRIAIRSTDGAAEPLAGATLAPERPMRAADDLSARVDDLLRGAPHPLFARHLRSLQALVQSERARTVMDAPRDPGPALEVARFAATILKGLDGEAGRWESYWRDGLPLCLAFTSPTDGALQRYLLTLPNGWDPGKGRDEQAVFPLFVELHGSGNPSPLAAPAAAYDPAEPAPDAQRVVPSRRTYAAIERAGYHVMPHGRGNLGYKGIGEADVWEALADAGASFAFDADRQYLYGFSMGGGGTWRLATRTPDRWAAVAIFSPSILWRGAPPWAVAENLAPVPAWMWCGEDDRLLEDHAIAAERLARAGGRPVAQSTPGVGHVYVMEMQEKAVRWMQQFRRRRPDRFSFVADTDEHPGIWGVEMARDAAAAARPRLECRVEGRTVRIDTTGTPALRVNPGAGGLGLDGEVEIVWNGRVVHRGPATPIDARMESMLGPE